MPIRLGHAFESEAVIRQGLEQIAWTFGIRGLDAVDQVDETLGTWWVTKLKSLFPGVGKFYGLLTNYAHLAPKTHARFLGKADLNKCSRSSHDGREHARVDYPVGRFPDRQRSVLPGLWDPL
jgi:hypothetical protein